MLGTRQVFIPFPRAPLWSSAMASAMASGLFPMPLATPSTPATNASPDQFIPVYTSLVQSGIPFVCVAAPLDEKVKSSPMGIILSLLDVG